MTNILIGGGPKVGKTTLLHNVRRQLNMVTHDMGLHTSGVPVHTLSSDALRGPIDIWELQPDMVEATLSLPGHVVIEGVSTVRAVRRMLRAGRTNSIDLFIWLGTENAAKVPLTPGQRRMSKGTQTIFNSMAELQGVEVLELDQQSALNEIMLRLSSKIAR